MYRVCNLPFTLEQLFFVCLLSLIRVWVVLDV